MNASTLSTRSARVRAGACTAFAIGALAVFCSGGAQAASESPQAIKITGTRVRTIPYDPTVRRPVQEVSVTARVPADLDVLTLNSGVALLKDNVRDAARTACMKADPEASASSDATTDCIHEAIDSAQPQIDALIARARSEETKG